MRRFAPPLRHPFAWILLGLAAALLAPPSRAALTLGPADPAVGLTCPGGEPDMMLDLTSGFDVLVRNCSGVEAGALVSLAYATPGGVLSSLDDYGMDERRISFSSADEEIRVPIDGIVASSGVIVDIQVVGFQLTGGSFAQRVLGDPLQAGRTEGGGGTQAVLQVTDALRAEIQRDVFMRSLTNPDGGAVCSIETNQAMADNRGRNTYRGTFVNKVMCSEQLDTPVSCATTAESATHAQQDSIDLAPEAFLTLLANQPSGGSGSSFFDVCCDPGHSTKAVVQCGQMVVQELKIDGQWVTLSPMVRIPWGKDIQVIDSGITAGDVNFGCDDFGSSPLFDPNGAAFAATIIQDSDSDGMHDACDFLVKSAIHAGSTEEISLKRRLRNQDFAGVPTFSTFEDVNRSFVGGVEVTPSSVTADEITLPVPPGLAPGSHKIELCDKNACNGPFDRATAMDRLEVNRPAFVSVGGQDYLLPFDENSGAFLDLSPQFDDSVPDIPDGAAPGGVLYTTEPGNENNEILIAAGMKIFAYEIAGNQFLDVGGSGMQGADLGAAVGALALPVGTSSDRVGEFLFALHGDRDLSVVDVRSGAAPRFDVRPAASLSFSTFASDLVVRAMAGDEFLVYVTFSCLNCESSLATSSNCGLTTTLPPLPEPLGGIEPCPPGGCGGGEPGGGGGSGGGNTRRTLGVSVIRLKAQFDGAGLKPGADAFDVLCYDDIPLSSFGGITGEELEQAALPWAQVGLDFTTDGSELFIADPERDQLFILDTTTNELVMDGSVPKTIPVGVDPFDVEILQVNVQGVDRDRAYVANHGDETVAQDDTLAIVDTANRQAILPHLNLNTDFTASGFMADDLQIERLTGSESSKLLFMLSPNRERIFVYDMSVDGDTPQARTNSTIITGPAPHQVAVQK